MKSRVDSSGRRRARWLFALTASLIAHAVVVLGLGPRVGVHDRERDRAPVTVELLAPPTPAPAPVPTPAQPAAPQAAAPKAAAPPSASWSRRAARPVARPPPPSPPPSPEVTAPPVSAASASLPAADPSVTPEPAGVPDPLAAPGAGPLAAAAGEAPGQSDTPSDGASSGRADGPAAAVGPAVVPGPSEAPGAVGTGADPPRDAPSCGPQAADESPASGPRLPEPTAGSWRYDIYFGDYADQRTIARLELRLERDDDRYTLRSMGEARGLTALLYAGQITQSSSGRVGPQGLQPDHYAEQRGARAPRRADVDAGRCEVTFGDQQRVPLPAGAQDRLSSLVQLGLLARAQPARFAAGADIELPEISSGSVDVVRYRSDGDQTLQTPAGALRALHLTRQREAGSQAPTIEIWLGYDFGMLPVRIRVTEFNGRIYDQLLDPSHRP